MGKIGLVLSGGVAKGAFEVGVLEALAERDIRPSAIVGVSAGALHGAVLSTMLAEGSFTPAHVRTRMGAIWAERISLSRFYHASDPDAAHGDVEHRSVSNLLQRFGIDPFRWRYLPTRWDPAVLRTLEAIVRGRFSGLLSQRYLRELAQDLRPPQAIREPVLFSTAFCNLMGETRLDPAGERIESAWTHYEDFAWGPGMAVTAQLAQRDRMVESILASCAFPLVFSPKRMTYADGEKTGIFMDGGMTDNSPIGKAIALDPEIDTVFVVMATTIVKPLEKEPQTIYHIFSRMAEMLAGKFLINNFHQVNKVNRRILALSRVLERSADGGYRDSDFNRDMVVAAGFKDLADFARRRVVRLIPVTPAVPLKGDLFAGFTDRQLLKSYMAQGLDDGRRALDALDLPGELEAS